MVEVGCDHGYIALSCGAIGTERHRHRLPREVTVPLVVADGLRPFRRAGVAIIAGIGAHAIARILSEGCRPDAAILHAPDRPGWLRRWCATHGWCIDAEVLAPEGGRFAEVIRVLPGQETATGLDLEFGPRLLQDPWLDAHIEDRLGYWRRVEGLVAPHDPDRARYPRSWIAFLEAMRATRRSDGARSGSTSDAAPPLPERP